MRRPLFLALLLVSTALAICFLVVLRRRAQEPRDAPVEPSTPEGSAARSVRGIPPPPSLPGKSEAAGAASDRLRPFITALSGALDSGDRPAVLSAVRTLRSALAADAALVQPLGESFLDPSAEAGLREALAVVLGSLPEESGGKRILIDALRRDLGPLERVAILALGMEETPDGEEFERDDQPHAVKLNGFFTAVVRGALKDADAREAVLSRLSLQVGAAERLAAARVLRDSTTFPEVRRAFFERLRGEGDPEVLAETAAALGEWARGMAVEDTERTMVIDTMFDIVPGADEAVRFRLTSPLSAAPLAAREAERLGEIARAGSEDARRFAVDVLGRRLDPRRPPDEAALAPLLGSLGSDSSPHVREAAALALGRAAGDPAVAGALARALREDLDWEVRATAARALAAARDAPEAGEALTRAGAEDPHPEVRAAATEALGGPRPPGEAR